MGQEAQESHSVVETQLFHQVFQALPQRAFPNNLDLKATTALPKNVGG